MPINAFGRPLRALILLAAVAALAPPARAQWSFTDLGDLGSPGSWPMGLNAAGQVAGTSHLAAPDWYPYSREHAFRYDAAGGMLDLGHLGDNVSFATAINAAGAVTGSSFAGSGTQHAFRYSGGAMRDLGDLERGAGSSSGVAINASGQVAGFGSIGGGTSNHAFRTDGAVMTDLGTLSGPNSSAVAINDAGQVTGSADLAGGTDHAFLSGANGAAPGLTDLGTLGGNSSEPFAINASGQVAGASATRGDWPAHAFRYGAGAMLDLGTLGGSTSIAKAINDAGQVAGSSQTAGDAAVHAFLYSDGAGMTDLGALGGDESHATAINAAGQVAGWSRAADGSVRPFLYRDGEMIDLGAAATGIIQFAEDVYLNDAGQIAGNGFSSSASGQRAFLLTPVAAVPEPAPSAMLGLGLAVIGLAGARRYRPRHACARRAAGAPGRPVPA